MSRKRLAAPLVEPNGLVEQEFRKPAGGEPGETAIISETPEGKRRSPSSPCQPRKADSIATPAIDLTGYRTISNMPEVNFRGHMQPPNAKPVAADHCLMDRMLTFSISLVSRCLVRS
jgi:hypothetical protein